MISLVITLIPVSNKLKKYKNFFLNINDRNQNRTVLQSNPISVRIAPIARCNYGCLFCEIHKDNLLFPKRSKNSLDLSDIQSYEEPLSTAYSLSFYGGSEEPLLNTHFGEIVQYLKEKYQTKMMVNTNASTMNKALADILVEYGFDTILISYHAGTKEGYKKLMTGNVDKINDNIDYLQNLKQQKGKTLPILKFNFALHKVNKDEYTHILDYAKQSATQEVWVNKYYGGRNKLQDSQVSYEYDVEEGNRVLDTIYNYSKDIGVALMPQKPDYWKKYETFQWNENNFNAAKKCFEPWKNINFNPVLDSKDSHYISICNRISLFKIDYKTLNLSQKDNFKQIWNHPVLQYMRQSVNEQEDINPICKYCKNYDREVLRNTDASNYAQVRDNAVKDFLDYCHENLIFDHIEGLEVLSDNPLSDEKFKEKLKELDA
jgi:MoaA/NifB/PqqE/SkfB family radical SAM enzyme